MATLADLLRSGTRDDGSGDNTRQLVNALRGAAETGMTLGSGALAGLAGMPYGIYKGVTSGAYGTAEAPKIASKEAQQFMERNTYQPRTEKGQEYLQKIGRAFEESKLPPVMPEAALLGAIPKQAIAAQAEKALNALPKNVPVGMMFIGENANTWDAVAAATAKKMEKAGATPQEIWKETGTFKGPEGKWRQEISDDRAFLKGSGPYGDVVMNRLNALENEGQKEVGSPMLLEHIYRHPELMDSYSDLSKIQQEFIPKGNSAKGEFNKDTMRLQYELPNDEAKSVLLHELQHAIQDKEGFAAGGSPNSMILTLEDLAKQKREEAQKLFSLSSNQDPLNPQIIKPGARKKGLELEKEARQLDDKALAAYRSEQVKHDLYKSLAGEAEARATQARMHMTPEERRATFPYESYDVPKEQLIVRGIYQ